MAHEHMSTGGSAARTPRPVSDDDTVDNFPVDELWYFPFFPISKELKRKYIILNSHTLSCHTNQ